MSSTPGPADFRASRVAPETEVNCAAGSVPAVARAWDRARGIRPCRSAKRRPAMSKAASLIWEELAAVVRLPAARTASRAAASGPGRLTAGETTRTSRSGAGMLISVVLYNRIAYDAFV